MAKGGVEECSSLFHFFSSFLSFSFSFLCSLYVCVLGRGYCGVESRAQPQRHITGASWDRAVISGKAFRHNIEVFNILRGARGWVSIVCFKGTRPLRRSCELLPATNTANMVVHQVMFMESKTWLPHSAWCDVTSSQLSRDRLIIGIGRTEMGIITELDDKPAESANVAPEKVMVQGRLRWFDVLLEVGILINGQ